MIAILKKIFGSRSDTIHMHVHVHGTIQHIHSPIRIDGITTNKVQSDTELPLKAVEQATLNTIEPMLKTGDVAIPEVQFGDETSQ